MKRILLPTDFSKNAENAINYALQLYHKEVCTFILLHAYRVDGYDEESKLTPIPGEEALLEGQKKVETRLKKKVEKLKESPENCHHNFEFEAANKSLTTAVKEQLRKKNIELIIIGTQGHTGNTEVVYGSNTMNLMEEIRRCPLLAVPAHVKFHALKEIVLANSFKAELTPKDLKFLIRLSLKFWAPIRILHICEEGGLNEKQKQNRRALRNHLKEEKVAHSFHTLEHLSIPLGVYSFTESRESEMVAFINKKHSFLENLLFDPLYKNLAHYSKVPVLVLHQP